MPAADLNQLIAFFFNVSGRATRQEYLLGLGFIFSLNAAILNIAIGQATGEVPFGTLLLLTLPFMPSQLVIAARRCHDLGLPGGFVLLFIVPFVGLFWMIALALIPGSAAANPYGPPVRYRSE